MRDVELSSELDFDLDNRSSKSLVKVYCGFDDFKEKIEGQR